MIEFLPAAENCPTTVAFVEFASATELEPNTVALVLSACTLEFLPTTVAFAEPVETLLPEPMTIASSDAAEDLYPITIAPAAVLVVVASTPAAIEFRPCAPPAEPTLSLLVVKASTASISLFVPSFTWK